MATFIDLSGQKFGKLTVLRRTHVPKHIKNKNGAFFLCLCDCGRETIVSSGCLRSGNTKSCGCAKNNDLTGQVFGKLLVIKRVPRPENRSIKTRDSFWLCHCQCGKETILAGGDLKRNTSCGCNRTFSSPEEARMSVIRRIFTGRYDDGDLSIGEFITLSQLPCFYCGEPPNRKFSPHSEKIGSAPIAIEHGYFIYNGLDRIDQNAPHNKNNVVTCCATCNWMKAEHSRDEFLKHVAKIFRYQTSRTR